MRLGLIAIALHALTHPVANTPAGEPLGVEHLLYGAEERWLKVLSG